MYINTQLYTNMCTQYIHIYIYICIHVYIYTYIHVCMYVWMYVCMYVYKLFNTIHWIDKWTTHICIPMSLHAVYEPTPKSYKPVLTCIHTYNIYNTTHIYNHIQHCAQHSKAHIYIYIIDFKPTYRHIRSCKQCNTIISDIWTYIEQYIIHTYCEILHAIQTFTDISRTCSHMQHMQTAIKHIHARLIVYEHTQAYIKTCTSIWHVHIYIYTHHVQHYTYINHKQTHIHIHNNLYTKYHLPHTHTHTQTHTHTFYHRQNRVKLP